MALQNLTPVQDTLQGWQLLTPDDMHSALEYLAAKGYTGSVNSLIDPGSGALTWQLILQSTTRKSSLAVAVINDWVIIENDAIASICPAEEFDARYQTTP